MIEVNWITPDSGALAVAFERGATLTVKPEGDRFRWTMESPDGDVVTDAADSLDLAREGAELALDAYEAEREDAE